MLIAVMAASLEKSANLRIIQSTNWDEVSTLTEDSHPDVLMYDLPAASESCLLSLLFKNPDLLLIGLDVETNRAVLLAGKESRSLTLEQVKEFILTC